LSINYALIVSSSGADIKELLAKGTQLLLQAKTEVNALRHRASEIETAEKAVAVLVAETGILDPDLVVDAERLKLIQVDLQREVDRLDKVLNATFSIYY
jgi:hypothetical protein